MPDPMCGIDHAQDAILFAHPSESLKWESHSRQRDDGVENGHLGVQPVIEET